MRTSYGYNEWGSFHGLIRSYGRTRSEVAESANQEPAFISFPCRSFMAPMIVELYVIYVLYPMSLT